MKSTIQSIRSGLVAGLVPFVLISHSAALAAVVTLPPGLSPGDSYRLVFVTTGLFRTTPTDIGVYDSYVTAQAAESPALAALGTEWRVLGSTPVINAALHTDTNPAISAGVPIYNLAGQLVASGNADLWDGTLAHGIATDQSGNLVNQKVFTGTAADGTALAGFELGSNTSRVQYGQADLANSGWTSIDWGGSLAGLHLYGISDPITVVPEPSTWLLVASAGWVAGVRRRRR
jgi:hypothetical protein